MTYRWIPGTPPDETALRRLKQHFPKPSEPPPQAWFMGEVSYYPSIIQDAADDIPLRDLEWYFRDTSAGLRIFTQVEFAQQRWRETFSYLLPRLIHRCHEEYMLSDLIGYFFHVHPDAIPDGYPECRSDMLNTLGNAIMGPAFWGEDDLSEATIQREWNIYHLYAANDFDLKLSPAMYFCLKYLTPSEIDTWAESLFQIEGRYWHFHLLNWLFKETFQLLIWSDAEGLPASQIVKPELSFGVSATIPEFSLPTSNVLTFIKKLKAHGLYVALSAK